MAKKLNVDIVKLQYKINAPQVQKGHIIIMANKTISFADFTKVETSKRGASAYNNGRLRIGSSFAKENKFADVLTNSKYLIVTPSKSGLKPQKQGFINIPSSIQPKLEGKTVLRDDKVKIADLPQGSLVFSIA